MAETKDYRQVLTDKLIEQLEAGTAPWQKPWDAREGGERLPYNPTTEKPYRGANSLYLSAVAADKGYADPRWATYKQADAEGWQVRKGEKGSLVEYWKFSETKPELDGKGKPVIGEDGQPKTVEVMLESPRVFRAVVFNAQQMDNVPELSKAPRMYEWDPMERAEQIMKSSGAKVFHDQNDRAFYSPSKDEIHLPARDQFKDQTAYYSTALHELGHWTGHDSRLKREFGGAFGSAEYAKEELRAELSSYFMADKLGVPHEPGQHAAYVKSWVKVLQEDKNEIFRAARDAEKITEYVLALDRQRERGQDVGQELGGGRDVAKPAQGLQLTTERTPLEVPFKEKEAAKAVGAKWDKEAKGWYAPEGTDLAPLAKWLPKPAPELQSAPANALDDPRYREQLQGLKDVTAALNGEKSSPVRLSTDPKPEVPGEKTWLAVPYPEKDKAREAGAKWDKEAKAWFAPAGADLEQLAKWVPKREVAQSAELKQNLDPKAEFGAAIKAAGLVIDGDPIMDGKLHRVPVEGGKKGMKDGAYVGYSDGRPSGHIQNYLTGSKENWTAAGVQLTAEELAQLAAQSQLAKQQRAAELSEQHGKAADKSLAKWERLPDAPANGENAYLARKGVQPHGVKFDGERLVVPVRDVDGKLWSVQSISPEEGAPKMFEKGGRKTGNMHVMGELKPGAEVLVAEGYATGASLREATGKTVAVAFDSGNLDAVVSAIKQRFPTSQIYIMGDNDKHSQQNVGVEKAMAAAQKHQVGVAFPEFQAAGKLTDFNDLHAKEGLATVKAQVDKALGMSMQESREQAATIARQQLGNGVEVKDAGPNTRHTGEVLGVTGYHATQATGRNAAVVHAVADLDQRPTPGKVATIQYRDGRGKVQDRPVEPQKQLQR